jgi:ADP-ribosylglycohydrolase
MTTPPSMRDRYVGCLVGAALGDALGKLTEPMDYDQVEFRYGPQGVLEPPAKALYTDDTQMAIATARALVEAGGEALPYVMEAVVRHYLRWYDQQNSPVYRRAPGLAVIDALARIHRGVPHTAAADGGANDSIVATRSVPVALRYRGDPQKIIETAYEISRMTHAHPSAVTGGAASALLVDFALGDLPLDDWIAPAVRLIRRHTAEAPREVVEGLHMVEKTKGWAAEDALERQFRQRPGYGGGWVADEAVGMGLWCFMAAPSDFVAAARMGANAPGISDTDSVAFLAGALAGARNGIGAIPPDWVARLEDGELLRELAEDLYRARASELGEVTEA